MKIGNLKWRKIASAALAGMILLSSLPAFSAQEREPLVSSVQENSESDALRLWYTAPSSKCGASGEKDIWQQCTLPIGNGDIGANVYGEIVNERLTFNEKTLWTGGPSESRPDYNGGNLTQNGQNGETMKQIQQLFAEGKDAEASSLCNKLVGTSDGYGSYQSWGNIYFNHTGLNENNITGYVRDLDLNNAIASVEFDSNGTHYTREYFISNPDNVLVAHFTAEGSGKLNMEITFPSNQGGKTVAEGNSLYLAGEVSDNQLKYDSVLKAVTETGKVDASGDKLVVSGAQELTVYVSADTDYKNEYPKYRTGETAEELHEKVNTTVENAAAKPYEEVKNTHVEDYSDLFGRVELDLGQSVSDKTTDALLKAYNNGTATEEEQRQLEVMLFQYGRYLTIASSRENSELPSNLQGVWNNVNNPQWSSDYHMNVNLQMNYWPTYSTNLAECADPLIRYVDSLREPGRVTAAIYAGVVSEEGEENGFMAHTQNTPFGWTCPGWAFSWGWSPAAVPWILQNCWEYYEYTGDYDYMVNNIYPMLREEAMLYNSMLIKDEDRKYVSSPTYSPEQGPYTAGNTYEQSLIWQLFEDAITAGKLVGEDEEVIAQWQEKQDNLKGPIEIGDDGQIKEWYIETSFNKDENGNTLGEGYGHRHLSHMLGLFPGDLITEDTPEWFEAAKVSMNMRTDSSTGWGMGQRINTWARLGDGNRAHKLITDLFKSGIYMNLWDTHPPFQIDGNFGMTSGVSEMLVQSNAGYINLLPALPDEWAKGSVSGLVARGNFEITMNWENKSIQTATLLSNNGGKAIVQADRISLGTVKDSDGNYVDFEVLKDNRISFETEAGKSYTISSIPAEEEKAEAPANIKAYKLTDGQTEILWDAVDAENAVYNVYRQINDGEWYLIGTDISDLSFKDTDAYDVLGTLSYKVSAVIDGEETKLSDAVSVQDMRNMAGMIDDQDSRIVYSGNWGNWTGDADNYKGTIKFLETPNGSETISLTFCGTGIEVLTCKNHDRGTMRVDIDGVDMGTVDTYSPTTQRQIKIFSKDDLEYGIHTITLTATGEHSAQSSKAKLEFDGFNVLDNSEVYPESLKVVSANGMTTVSKADTQLQMKTYSMPDGTENTGVVWSVETKSGNTTAKIDENGLLTLDGENGVVTVKAAMKNNGNIAGTVDITVAIPTENDNYEIVEDSVNKANPNPAITWNGSWSTWAGEPTRHHGGTKTDGSGVDSSFSYTFTGTGIELYAQKNLKYGKYTVVLDGENAGEASLVGTVQGGEDQQLVYSKLGLENKEHTITFTVAAVDGNTTVNMDYFKVYKPSEEIVDKSQLQEAIEKYSDRTEAEYTQEAWAPFEAAMKAAVEGMNSSETTAEQVQTLADNLNKAGEELDKQEIVAPEFEESAKAVVSGIESDKVTLIWDKAECAVSYKVVVNDNEGAEVKTAETENSYLQINELNPNTEYVFKVYGVNRNGKASETPLTVKGTTAAPIDNEAPAQVTGLAVTEVSGANQAKITWEKTTDPQGSVITYEVYINGIKAAETQETEFIFDVIDGASYSIRIVAVDEAGNKSLPAVYNYATGSQSVKGDVNKDGKADVEDVTLIQKFIVKIDLGETIFDEKVADVNGDGVITVIDATEIQIMLGRS